MEPEGLERVAGPGIAAASGAPPGRETDVVADGVRDVLRGVDPAAVSAGADGPAVDLPVSVVEPVARGVPPAGGSAAGLLAVLKRGSPKSGSGCPDASGPRTEERG